MANYDASQGVENSLSNVDIKSCAVLVVDITGDVEGSPLEDILLAPTLNAAKIADAARDIGVPVIFANDAHIEGIDSELELWGKHGIDGSPDAETSKELNMTEGDYLVKKSRYSAFFQTNLRLLLNELNRTTLILCGFDTNICIASTAADAFYNGYDIIVPKDATATFLIGTQEGGLDYMNRCHAARIVTTEDVLALFSK